MGNGSWKHGQLSSFVMLLPSKAEEKNALRSQLAHSLQWRQWGCFPEGLHMLAYCTHFPFFTAINMTFPRHFNFFSSILPMQSYQTSNFCLRFNSKRFKVKFQVRKYRYTGWYDSIIVILLYQGNNLLVWIGWKEQIYLTSVFNWCSKREEGRKIELVLK